MASGRCQDECPARVLLPVAEGVLAAVAERGGSRTGPLQRLSAPPSLGGGRGHRPTSSNALDTVPTSRAVSRLDSVIEFEDVPDLAGPDAGLRVRGLERRRRRRDRRARPPRSTSGTPSSSARSTPRTSTTSRSTGRWSPPTTPGCGRIEWPTTRLYVARPPGCPRDVVLLRGIEPNMRWRAFCAELLAAADDLGVRAGGHARARCWPTRRTPGRSRSPGPPPSWSCEDRLELEPPATRARPASSACFQDACVRRDSRRSSFWAAVPHYVAAAAVPEGDAGAARPGRGPAGDQHPARRPARGQPRRGSAASTSWPRRTRRSPSTSAASRSATDTADLPEANGEAIAREFERYLKRRDRPEGGPTPS